MKKSMMIALMALLGALALAACGDEEDSGEGSGSAASDAAEVASGQFEMVETAPEGTGEITGTAELVRQQDGTVARIDVSGLEPGQEYISHVHAGDCDQPDPGGPHYKFDLSGSDTPPNEIHLSLTADEEGTGSAEVTNDQVVPEGEAPSIVLHLASEGHGGGKEDGHSSDGDHGGAEGHSSEGDSETSGSSFELASDHREEGSGKKDGGSGHDHSAHGKAPKLACAQLS